MAQNHAQPREDKRADRRWLRLGVRWGILIVAVVFASQGLTPHATLSAPYAPTAVVAPWWQDIHRSEWSAVLPSLSPYVAVLAAIARRGIAATILLGLPVLALGIFWMRGFCRYACPMGLLLEMAGKVNPAGMKLVRFPRLAKWVVLTTAVSALFGFPLFLWLDPLSMFLGLIGAVRWPLTTAMTVAVIPFLIVFVVSVIWPGSWCYRVCPLGYVQELVHAKRWFPNRQRSNTTVAVPAVVQSAHSPAILSRRSFLFGITGFVAGGVAFATRKTIGAHSTVLRPPGAVSESLFQGLCIRCGNCVRACPSKIIQPDLGSSGVMGLITPKLRMGPGYCAEGCNECGKVCPSGAIEKLLLTQKNRRVIGLACIDRNRCWPWKGVRECDKCVTICPSEAIDNFRKNPPMPVMLTEKCNGCGKCQIICPAAAIVVKPLAKDEVKTRQ